MAWERKATPILRQGRLHPNRKESDKERAITRSAPALDRASSVVLACWRALETERYLTDMVSGPIPWRAIMRWCRVQRLRRDRALVVAEAIRLLDVERSERISSELKHPSKKAPKPKSKGKKR